MTAEVDAVLQKIKDNYGTVGVAVAGHSKTISDLSDVPLQRIDRDNSDNLDKAGGLASVSGPIHDREADLQEMNYVSAASASRSDDPLGTTYNLRTDRVVSVRVEGLHAAEYGAIDPQKGTSNERSRAYPTITWQDLLLNIRRSILADRTFPNTSAPTVSYKDLFIENFANEASTFGDYYLATFDVRFSGFETLP